MSLECEALSFLPLPDLSHHLRWKCSKTSCLYTFQFAPLEFILCTLYTTCVPGTCKRQKRAPDPRKLELQTVASCHTRLP